MTRGGRVKDQDGPERRCIVTGEVQPKGGLMRFVVGPGAVIVPANPGFYHRPACVADLVDFVVARILDLLDVPHTLLPRWGEPPAE